MFIITGNKCLKQVAYDSSKQKKPRYYFITFKIRLEIAINSTIRLKVYFRIDKKLYTIFHLQL